MECPSCGANLRDNAVFCSSCGHRVGGPTTVTPTVQVPIPPREQPTPAVAPTAAGPSPARDTEPGPRFEAPRFEAPRPAPNPRPMPGLGGVRTSAAGANPTAAIGYLQRLLRLDTSIFRDARDDPGALIPSIVVVAVSLVLASLGSFLWAQFKIGDLFNAGQFLLKSVLFGTLFGVALWAAWIAIAATLLSNVFKQRAAILPLLGSLGFAMLPMALGFLALIDVLHIALGVAAVAASAMLTQVGLQEATDAPPGQVFAANLAGFLVFAVVLGFLGQGDSQLAPGVFALPQISFNIPNFNDIFPRP